MRLLTRNSSFFLILILFIAPSLACGLNASTSGQRMPTDTPQADPEKLPIPIPTESALQVWRSPILWMPHPDTFTPFAGIPLKDVFSYTNQEVSVSYENSQATLEALNQAGRLVSFGYGWWIDTCPEALAADVYDGRISVVVYQTPQGAQRGFEYFKSQDELDDTIEVQTGLDVGEISAFFFRQFTDCEMPGKSFEINLRRSNIYATVYLSSLAGLSDNELKQMALEGARELDRLIQSEVQSSPAGSQFVMPATGAPLVWRYPEKWMPAPETISTFREVRLAAVESNRNEDIANASDDPQKTLQDLNRLGRVVSYGYKWAEPCSDVTELLLPYGRLTVILYDNPDGAQSALDEAREDLATDAELISIQEMGVGEDSFTSIRDGESCGIPARYVYAGFRRHNVFGVVRFATQYSGSVVPDSDLTEYAIRLSQDLDQTIQDEAATHPGTMAALQLVRVYAPTSENLATQSVSSVSTPQPPLGNNDYIDDGVSDGCVDLSTSDAVGPCYYYSVPPVP